MKTLIFFAALATSPASPEDSIFIHNGTGLRWAQNANATMANDFGAITSSSLQFAVGGAKAMIWHSCGCAELYLGHNRIIFPCAKHERPIIGIKTKVCRCRINELAQGYAVLPCAKHEPAMGATMSRHD
jgi:hypothetical protein